jgi:hypothetical protein
MHAAAERRDSVALSDYVDFPALRESLKASFNARMTKGLPSSAGGGNPFAGLGLVLAQAMVDRLVDGFVTPEGLAAMMAGVPPGNPQPSTPEATESHADEEFVRTFGYESLGRFTVRFAPPDKPEEALVLVLLRDGLSWKLSAIRFPAT